MSAAAVLLMASCSKDQVTQTNPGEAIQFKAFTKASSKAVSSTAASVSDFTVVAYKPTGTGSDFSVYFKDTYNKQEQGTPTWVPASGTRYYWPTNTTLTFLGHSPADISAAFKANPTIVSDAPSSAAIQNIQPKQKASEQVDLLVYRSTGSESTNSGTVTLFMQHAFSQIIVKAKNSNSNMKVEVAGVKIAKANGTGTLSYPQSVTSGTAAINANRWSTLSGPTSYIAGGQAENIAAPVELQADTTAKIMFGTTSFMLIPQTLTKWAGTADDESGAYIALLCRISQSDGNGGWVQQFPANAGNFGYAAVGIGETWTPGTTYTYVLDFFNGDNGGGIQPPTDPEEPVTEPEVDPTVPGEPVVGGPISFTVDVRGWDNGNTGTGGTTTMP